MRSINRTRDPISDDVTKTRRISTLDHCRGSRAWEQTSPAQTDNRPTRKEN